MLHIIIYNMLHNTKFTAHPPLQPGCSADASKTHSFTLPGADHLSYGWLRWVARGLQHLGSGLRCCCRRLQQWSSAAAAADCLTLRSMLGPRGSLRGLDAKGDSFARLVMNESSWGWIGAVLAGWQESRLQIQNVLYNSIYSIVI